MKCPGEAPRQDGWPGSGWYVPGSQGVGDAAPLIEKEPLVTPMQEEGEIAP